MQKPIKRKNTIQILNLKNDPLTSNIDFRIDRYSPIGNPYILKNESQRNIVCDKYEIYFNNMVKDNDQEFMKYLNNLIIVYKKYKRLRLFCWCSPKRCHGEIIKQYILKKICKN